MLPDPHLLKGLARLNAATDKPERRVIYPEASAAAVTPDRVALLREAAQGVKIAKPSRSELLAAAGRPRPRMVFAVDATASREDAWATARKVTDALLQAVPGALHVALVVHGGGSVHTFTEFFGDAGKIRDVAASIKCQAGGTRLVDIMQRTSDAPGVKVLLYIGDSFEEAIDDAYRAADKLKERGTRMIILRDGMEAADAFTGIAKRTDGFVLPFDASAAARIREILEAVAVLAVGGVKMLEAKKKTLAAAPLLLSHLTVNK